MYAPLKDGASTTKGKKKIHFLNHKSSREISGGRWSNNPKYNHHKAFKQDSTGGIDDGEDINDSSTKRHKRTNSRKLSGKGIKSKNSNKNDVNSYGINPASFKNKKLSQIPIEVAMQQNQLSLEENDLIMGYLKNFIKSNKIKLSTQQQREKEKNVKQLREFLKLLENKKLISSKITDNKQIQILFDELVKSEADVSKVSDDKIHHDPYSFAKIYPQRHREGEETSGDLKTQFSKRKQSQRLIFQQSRSERNSVERSGKIQNISLHEKLKEGTNWKISKESTELKKNL